MKIHLDFSCYISSIHSITMFKIFFFYIYKLISIINIIYLLYVYERNFCGTDQTQEYNIFYWDEVTNMDSYFFLQKKKFFDFDTLSQIIYGSLVYRIKFNLIHIFEKKWTSIELSRHMIVFRYNFLKMSFLEVFILYIFYR